MLSLLELPSGGGLADPDTSAIPADVLRVPLATDENAPTTPWAAASELLDALASRLGQDVFMQARHHRTVAMALLKPSLRIKHTAEQRLLTTQVSGACVVALPTLPLTPNPVLEALCEIVVELISQGPDIVVVVKRLSWLDLESLTLLKRMMSHPEVGKRMRLVIQDKDRLYRSTTRHTPNPGSLNAERARRIGLCVGVTELARMWDATLQPASDDRPVPAPRRRLSSASHLAVRSHLATSVQVTAAAMRHASNCHAFSIALVFAERLARMDGVGSVLLQEAALVAGASAHVLGPDDELFSTLASEFFAQVASRNADMALRSYACMRLAIHEARHRQRFPQAMRLADEAVRYAADHNISAGRSAIYRAWAGCARGYVQARLGQPNRAAQSCTDALNIMTSQVPRDPAVPSSAIDITIPHLRRVKALIRSQEPIAP